MKMQPSYVASWDIVVSIPISAENGLVKDMGQYWVILVATEQNGTGKIVISITGELPEESPVEGSLKIVDGFSVYSGRIEIYHNGEWGTICDDDWDDDDAQVACRQLGYPTVDSYGGSAYYGDRYGSSANYGDRYDSSAYYGESYGGSAQYGPIMLDDVICDGSEYMLTQCGHNGWYQHNCDHGEDAWVTCQIP
ncbi:putative deleted in malignant brain tumors 1 protein-like, partial [Apostichopus japonicus]